MARNFKPKSPFNVSMRLLIPESTRIQGVLKKSYTDPNDGELFFGTFRTWGGTETTQNDVYTIVDTGTVNTWYRPDIKADCRIYMCDSEQVYEIISDPENIDMRNQYLQFKVRKVGGKP